MTWLECERMIDDEDWLLSVLRDGTPVFSAQMLGIWCVLSVRHLAS